MKIEKLVTESFGESDDVFKSLILAHVDFESLQEHLVDAIKAGCPTEIAINGTAEAAAAMLYRAEAAENIPNAELRGLVNISKSLHSS